jgi:hypothetical protein
VTGLKESLMNKNDLTEILIFVFILAFAVVVVEERWLRAALAFVPALLLAQRGLLASKILEDEPRVGAADRREDVETRSAVDELLKLVREFYLTCHLMGSGRMESDEAVEKTAKVEKELNRILANITEGARTRARQASTLKLKV